MILVGSRAGSQRADGWYSLAHVSFAGPSCRTAVAVERPATAIPNGPTVVVAALRRTLQRVAHLRRAHTEVIDAIPSRRTVIAAIDGVAAAIADLSTVVVPCARLAGYRMTDGGIALADMVSSACPLVLRAGRATGQRPTAAVPNGSAIGPTCHGAPGEAIASSAHAVLARLVGRTAATMQRLSAAVADISAVLSGS